MSQVISRRRVARLGDPAFCPRHGSVRIVSGQAEFRINGHPVARQGDRLSCGAIITSGAAHARINGRPIARAGDSHSHGGVLLDGTARCFITGYGPAFAGQGFTQLTVGGEHWEAPSNEVCK